MTFRRTLQGLSNLHLFYGVDLVVFVEGGEQSITKEQVLTGEGGAESVDVSFWRNMFRYFSPEKTMSFRSVGSKGVLLSIAEDMKNGSADHICVAMDSDHDAHFCARLRKAGVFYTYGYSWENDVHRMDVIRDVFEDYVSPVINPIPDITDLLRGASDRLERDIKWYVYADIVVKAGGRSLFQKNRKGIAVVVAEGHPRINKKSLRSELKTVRATLGKYRLIKRSIRINPSRDCCGYLLSFYYAECVKHFVRYFKIRGIPKMPQNYYNGLMIKKFFGRFADGQYSDLHDHYKAQFESISCARD